MVYLVHVPVHPCTLPFHRVASRRPHLPSPTLVDHLMRPSDEDGLSPVAIRHLTLRDKLPLADLAPVLSALET